MLGDGRIVPTSPKDVFDFCKYFKSSYALLSSLADDENGLGGRRIEAIKFAVRLAAMRVSQLPECMDRWESWAEATLPILEKLSA